MTSAPVSENEVVARLQKQTSLSERMLLKVLDVFEELAFIQRDEGQITFIPKPEKSRWMLPVTSVN